MSGGNIMENKNNETEKIEGLGESLKVEDKSLEAIETIQVELEDTKEKFLRLYADFENYKKKVQKDKEELIKYSNETLIYEILPIIDSLEMALKHASNENLDSLKQGVENTLRELIRTLEKFGLKSIEAINKSFDPAYHHAMSQVEREDVDDNTIVEELRKGYIFNEKVLRPSLVVVSKKTGH